MATKATSSKKAAEKKPAAKKSAMTKAAVTKAPEKKPAEKKASEKKPAERKAAETKPVEKKAAETKPAAKKAAAKPAEKKAAEKPAKVAEKKAAEKPAARVAEKKAPAKPVEKKPAEKAASAAPAPAPAEKAPEAKPVEAKPAEIAAPPKPAKAPAVGDITVEDAKRILADVRLRRSEPKGACRAALPLSFVNMREPKSAAELGPIERRQLVAAGADGLGEARTPEGWLADEDDGGYKGSLEVWDVVDAHGIPVYSLWMYLTDNGTVFRAGTIDVVGGISQSGLECAEEGLEEGLLDAQARLDKGVLKRSLIRFMG